MVPRSLFPVIHRTIARILLVTLIASDLSGIFSAGVDSVSAKYVPNGMYELISSGGAFTGVSRLDSYSGSFVNTGSLHFDAIFDGISYGTGFFRVTHGAPDGSGNVTQSPSVLSVTSISPTGSLSGAGDVYFSGQVSTTYSGTSLSGASLDLANMQDGDYEVLMRGEGDPQQDEIVYRFIVDTVAPQILNSGSITDIATGSVRVSNISIDEINLDTSWSWTVVLYGQSGSSMNQFFAIPNSSRSGSVLNANPVNLTGLSPDTDYAYRIRATDKAGNVILSNTGSFKTAAEPTNQGGGSTSANGGGNNPLKITFSNSGQVSATGTVTFSVTNDRPEAMSGITTVFIGLSDKFILNSPGVTGFSGAIAGKSCSGALTIVKDYDKNMIRCQLNSPISSFATGAVIEMVLSGVKNPDIAGRYPIGTKIKTSAGEQFFYGETFIKDNNDTTPPTVVSTYPISLDQIVVEFNEPIYIDNGNTSITGSFSPSLELKYSYADYNNPKKLFIGTSTQSGARDYGFSLNNVKDFNKNTTTATGSFRSFDENAKRLDYLSPSGFAQGKSYSGVTLYGKNNIFSGITATGITVRAQSGMTFTGLTLKTSNELTLSVSADSDATLGNRDFEVTIGTGKYRIFNGLWIEKNWDNYAFWQNVSPSNYSATNKTGKVKIEFSETITDTGSISVEKWYGTTDLTPSITSQTKSGKLLELSLTGVEAGVGYQLRFADMSFSGGKTLNEYNANAFFSFSDGNYANQILPPIVSYSFPGDFVNDVPVKDASATGFVMKVGFDQSLDDDTITTDNIKLKDESNNEVSISLSYTGTELTVTTDAPLKNSEKYALTLSANVKSSKGLNFVGNIPTSEGGGHKITFNTVADYSGTGSTAAGTFTIEKTDPFFQATDVPYNAKMRIILSDVIDKTTVTNTNIKLYYLTGTTQSWRTLSFTYDNDYTPKTIYLSGGTLQQNAKYKLVITSGVKSVKNQSLSVPSAGYIVEFKTGTKTAAEVPLTITQDYKSPDNTAFEVGFSSPIDASTINATTVALYQSGGSKVTAGVKYNHYANSVILETSEKLLDSTQYVLVLKAQSIKDIGGNSVATGSLKNNFVYNATNATVEKVYSTAGGVSVPFYVESFVANDDKVEIKFSKTAADALNKSNYVISYCNATGSTLCTPSTSLPLTDASLKYDDINRTTTIEGISLPASTSSAKTVVKIDVSLLKDKLSNSITGGVLQAVLMNDEVGTSSKSDTQAIELKANIRPQNNTAGKKTLYLIDFPATTQLSAGAKIEVWFPSQFDLSSARFDSGSYANYVDGDKTKPKFTIAKLADKNVLEYTITSHYANKLTGNDYIISDVQDIVNPTQAKDFTTDGYIGEITTKNSSGIALSKIKSNPVFIRQAATNTATITVHLQDKNGNTLSGATISGAVVGLNTPSGYEELLADNSGTVVYTGELNSNYSVFLSPDIRLKDTSNNTYSSSNYVSPNNQFFNILLDANRTVDIKLKDKTDATEFVTLAGSITGLSGKELTLWVAGPNGFYNKDLGIVGSPASYSIKVPKNAGYVSIWVGPTIAVGSTTYKAPDFMPPKPINTEVKTTNISSLDFVVETASTDFTVVVKDNSSGGGKAIPKANVYAYAPSGDSMGLYWQTDANGSVTFKAKAGIYKYGAFVEGLPNPTEKTITIGTGASYTGNLTVIVPTLTIAGKVLNGNDPISGVNVSAYNQAKGAYLNALTDASGNYKFYVADGTWKVGGWTKSYGPLEEKTLTVSGESLSDQNFTISQVGVYTITGSVNLSSSSGTGISQVNIFAESTDNDYTKNFFTFTDDPGLFSLSLKNGSYKIRAYHPQHGEIGVKNVTVSSANASVGAFVVEPPKSVTVSFAGAGLPSDLSKFEWMIDVFDSVNQKGMNKKIKSLSGYTFENVGSGTYDVKVNVVWLGQVFSSGSFVVQSNRSIDVTLLAAEQPVSLSGTVYASGTSTTLQDAFVEVRNTSTKQAFGVKTLSGGLFEIKLKKGTSYELMVRKPGYANSEVLTGTLSAATNVGSLYIKENSTTINISGTVSGSGSMDTKEAFLSLQGVNSDNTDSTKWFGQKITFSGSSFTLSGVPANFGSGKLIVATEGYEMKTDSVRSYGSSNVTGISLTLTGLSLPTPKTLPVTPAQGGVISDSEAGMKLTLPSNALGTSTDAGSVITKETSVIPNTPGSEPVGGVAKEITATDANGQPITNLSSDATIEITYSGSELVSTNTGITLTEVKNLQLSYYDDTAQSWVSLTTVVTSNSGSIFDNYTGSTLLSTLSPSSLTFTLRASTDHFTLFTALVSTVVSNSTSSSSSSSSNNSSSSGGGGGGTVAASLTSGLAATSSSVSKYLGETTQSIALTSGKNINAVFSIQRNGKTIALSDVLKTGAGTVSNVNKNLVNFAVGDVLSASKEGSIAIALDGYSKMNLSPGASMKIAEASSNFLSYENVAGTVQYQFDKRDGGKFQYQVKGKTGYATIRGTTLKVTSDTRRDVYNLIEGKVDIYNAVLKKTVSLVAGDVYIAYANGAEDTTKVKDPTPIVTTSNVTTTSAVSKACGVYRDLDGSSEWCGYVTKLKDKGVIKSASAYNPNKSITRAEFLKMVTLARGVTPTYNAQYTFSDINSADWWAPYVSTAKRLGYVSASNANFRPNDSITRAEAMKIIFNYSGTKTSYDSKYAYSDVRSSDWWAPYVSTAKRLGYVSASNANFRPADTISRAEVAKILSNVFLK